MIYGMETEKKTIYVPKKKTRLSKGRTLKTNKNKINKLKRIYRNLFKSAQKKKKNNSQGIYFCDKYPTCDSFLKKINIKKANN